MQPTQLYLCLVLLGELGDEENNLEYYFLLNVPRFSRNISILLPEITEHTLNFYIVFTTNDTGLLTHHSTM